jgi:NTP pyrophosphatase (non-canonical NTP hydrolase)
MSNLQCVANDIHATAKGKGFWDDQVDPNFVLAKLALIASEVSEVLEAYRKEMGAEKIAEEFADILIRTLDLYAGLQEEGIIPKGLDIDTVLNMKTGINKERPRKHGNLI